MAATNTNIESGTYTRDGYPALARWIAGDPDYEGFIFRRFDRLSARNLLNLQSRLLALEKAIDELDIESWRQHDTGLRRWGAVIEGANAKDGDIGRNPELQKKRLQLYAELEDVTQRYQDAVLRQSQFASISRPDNRVLSLFRSFFDGGTDNTGTALHPLLSGRAGSLLSDKTDLLAVRSPQNRDPLSRFLRDHWPSRWQRQKRDPTSLNKHGTSEHGVIYFPHWHVKLAAAILSTFVAAVLLVGSIVSLFVVKEPRARLAMISGWTVCFAICVGLTTDARRAEVFGATAAYAAVLVVFVSGDLGGGGGGGGVAG